MIPFDFHPEAEAEYLQVIHFYDEVDVELGDRFIDEFESCITRIQKRPLWFRNISRSCRRCLAEEFPYGIIYAVANRRIFIVAVMHLKQKPGYWKKRMAEIPKRRKQSPK